MARDLSRLAAALCAVALVTAAYVRWLHVTNATTVALTFLLVVLLVAATSRLWMAVATSVVAMLCFNFFFLPPVGTLTIADPQNWVALAAFLAVSLVASNLSSVARARADEALARRDELARLFDVSRDVLLMTEGRDAMRQLADAIARRFGLDYVAVCLPRGADWDLFEAGLAEIELDKGELARAFAGAERTLEFDAAAGAYAGEGRIQANGRVVRVVPVRFGTRPVGLLAVSGRTLEAGTLDALAGVAAIAVERGQLLEARKAAEVARQGEALKSALLASLGHDLRTPLTTIRVAASNLQASWLGEDDRREQAELVLAEVERLTRLFQNILDMARIEAGGVTTEYRWVHPSEIVEAARDQVEYTLRQHTLEVNVDASLLVRLDPRITTAALAHVLENASKYAPAASTLEVTARASREGLEISVRDHGPGISAADLPRLFERFYRGADAKRWITGTGMGLSIARGLLAAEKGRVWAENCPDGGARFTILVPAETKLAEAAEHPA